jgi:hypothetical protein
VIAGWIERWRALHPDYRLLTLSTALLLLGAAAIFTGAGADFVPMIYLGWACLAVAAVISGSVVLRLLRG